MKKLFLLTSVLGLAACMGGSGGGDAGIGLGTPSDALTGYNEAARVSTAAAESNGKVTKMKSEVVVASNSTTPVVTRAATTHSGGVTYTSYRLDDIKLYTADASNTGDGFLKIGMDGDGRIDKITMNLAGAGAPVARIDEENPRFRGPIFEYVEDEYAEFANNVDSLTETTTAGVTNRNALLNVVAAARGFEAGGEWEKVEVATDVFKYKYKVGGDYAKGDGGLVDYAIDATSEAVLDAIKNEKHLDDGRWVNTVAIIDGVTHTTYKYIEYGDEAVYRTVATNDMTMDDLGVPQGKSALGHWNRVDEVMDVVTYGKDIDGNGTALQYSDFGHFNPVYKEKQVDVYDGNGTDGWTSRVAKDERTDGQVETLLGREDYQLFAGGYAIHGTTMDENRPTLTPDNGAEYKGTAIGRVYVSIQGGGEGRNAKLLAWDVPYDKYADPAQETGDFDAYSNDAGHKIAKKFTTTEATMTIGANGEQTLVMPFNTESADGAKFYDVTIAKDGNSDPVFTFDGTPDGGKLYQKNTSEGTPEVDFNPGYYGVNTASEAAGTARYATEQDLGGGFEREWEFQAAYGMVKQ